MASPIKLFISYAHKDEDLRVELNEHLSNLQAQDVIAGWHDRQIVPGQDWANEIDKELNTAQIVLLLISASFIASKYCREIEMTRAMERHEAGEAIIIPVIVRACDWEGAPFSKLQGVPKNAKPVKSWDDRDEAWADVVREIRRAIARLQKPADSPAPPSPPEISKAKPVPPFDSATSGDSEKPIPRAGLPYLCNRSPQETVLSRTLQAHLAERRARPVLFLIHGDEREDYTGFLERLKLRVFPKHLNLEARGLKVEERGMAVRGVRQLDDFWPALGQALTGDSGATPAKIRQAAESFNKEPLMLILHLDTEAVAESGEELFAHLFAFWQAWPDLPSGCVLLNCVCLAYKRYEKVGLLNFTSRRRQQLNKRLQTWLKDFKGADFKGAKYPQITLAVIPELEAVTQTEVLAWTNEEDVRKARAIPHGAVRKLFQRDDLRDAQGRIPTDVLYDELALLLKANQ